jgi:hypothetical protein
MTVIALNPSEIFYAAMAGVMRQVENIKHKNRPAHGAGDTNDWQLHIEGTLGEYALSKWLNIHWPGKGKLRAPDVGLLDVRTRKQEHHKLILHKEDEDDRQFWLLTGNNGTYVINGWIFGRDGKQEIYWSDPSGGRPAYFVPVTALNPPDPLYATRLS